MQRRGLLALTLLGPLALNGCGFIVMHTARRIYKDMDEASSVAEVDQSLLRYREALLGNNTAQIAAFFADDAEWVRGGADPLKGRPAIQAALLPPDRGPLSACEWKAASTRVDGERVRQQGRFRQTRMATPAGAAQEEQGRFELSWARQGGGWRIMLLHTQAA